MEVTTENTMEVTTENTMEVTTENTMEVTTENTMEVTTEDTMEVTLEDIPKDTFRGHHVQKTPREPTNRNPRRHYEGHGCLPGCPVPQCFHIAESMIHC